MTNANGIQNQPQVVDVEPETDPYVALVSKKLRATRKKLQKVAQYEEKRTQGAKLNKDQQDAINNKDLLQKICKDFEEMIEQMKDISLKKASQDKDISPKKRTGNQRQRRNDKHMLDIDLVATLIASSHSSSEDELQKFYKLLVDSSDVKEHLQKLVESSTESPFEGSTYAELKETALSTKTSAVKKNEPLPATTAPQAEKKRETPEKNEKPQPKEKAPENKNTTATSPTSAPASAPTPSAPVPTSTPAPTPAPSSSPPAAAPAPTPAVPSDASNGGNNETKQNVSDAPQQQDASHKERKPRGRGRGRGNQNRQYNKENGHYYNNRQKQEGENTENVDPSPPTETSNASQLPSGTRGGGRGRGRGGYRGRGGPGSGNRGHRGRGGPGAGTNGQISAGRGNGLRQVGTDQSIPMQA